MGKNIELQEVSENDKTYASIGQYIYSIGITRLLKPHDKITTSNIAQALSAEYNYKIKKISNIKYEDSTKAYHINMLRLTFDRYNLISHPISVITAPEKGRKRIISALQEINAIPIILSNNELFMGGGVHCENGRFESLDYCVGVCPYECPGQEKAIQGYIDYYDSYMEDTEENHESYQDFLIRTYKNKEDIK